MKSITKTWKSIMKSIRKTELNNIRKERCGTYLGKSFAPLHRHLMKIEYEIFELLINKVALMSLRYTLTTDESYSIGDLTLQLESIYLYFPPSSQLLYFSVL